MLPLVLTVPLHMNRTVVHASPAIFLVTTVLNSHMLPCPSFVAGSSCRAQLNEITDGTGYHYLTLTNTGKDSIEDLILVDPNPKPTFIWGLTYSTTRGGISWGHWRQTLRCRLPLGHLTMPWAISVQGLLGALTVEQLACSGP